MANSIKIVIPMAGYGSRMRPLTWSRPKPLLLLAGKTLLDHALDQFATIPNLKNAEYVFIISPNQGNQIQEHMAFAHPDKKVHFIVQEKMQGQSHALLLAEEHLKGPFVMAFCDTLIETSLEFLREEIADGVAWVKPMEDPRRFGVAELNADGLAVRLVEKPQDCSNNLVLVGFYYFREGQDLMKAIREQIKRKTSLKGEYFLADAVNIMLETGMKLKVRRTDVWLDAGIPAAVLETNRYLLEKAHSGHTPSIGDGVTLIQPVSIASGVTIRNSVVGPHVTVGKNCDIENVILRNSIVDAETTIRDLVIEGSLIGRNALLQGKAEQFNLGDDSDFIR
jgi:glucose-1-phosphate thymidylyltransferase